MISAVISALSRGFDQLMTNQRGSLVIVKCLDVANTQQNKVISFDLCWITSLDTLPKWSIT